MTSTEQHLKRIQDKLQLLLKQMGSLQKENNELKEQLVQMKSEQEVSQEMLDRMSQQVEILRFSNEIMGEDEKKQFQKRINAYVKEIDRCIAMLGQ